MTTTGKKQQSFAMFHARCHLDWTNHFFPQAHYCVKPSSQSNESSRVPCPCNHSHNWKEQFERSTDSMWLHCRWHEVRQARTVTFARATLSRVRMHCTLSSPSSAFRVQRKLTTERLEACRMTRPDETCRGRRMRRPSRVHTISGCVYVKMHAFHW